jgi:hypothetical protein
MGTLAQSIKHTATLDDSEVYTMTLSTKTVTLSTGAVSNKTTQAVGTSAYEALSVGDVYTTNRYFVNIRNSDDTNYVLVNFSTSTAGSDFLQLEPGELAAFPVAGGVNVFLKAHTAACDVEVVVTGDATP